MTSERIPVAAPVIGEREERYVLEALRSGWVSSIGPFVDRFEREFAAYVGVEHAISVSNGTVALHLALHALGVGAGDEVLVPALTFAATAHAVLQTGAVPVLVDVEPDTGCISPSAAARAITARTRAILPVHLYGHPADMRALNELAEAHRLHVIEDAAEAHGARVGDRQVGSLSRVGAFSFYGNKLMTTGEGGMLTTSDGALAQRLRFLKDHGMSASRRYFHSELAFNYRMTNLQAALGAAQLEQLDGFLERRRRLYGWYREALGDLDEASLNVERPGTRNVFWMVCLTLADGARVDRDTLASHLSDAGIDSRPFFVSLDELPHLQALRRVGVGVNDCPVSRSLSRRGLNLPSGAALGREHVDRVARVVRQWLR